MTMKRDNGTSDLIKAREDLVRMGLLRDSGRRRSGQTVWEITEAGKAYCADMIDADQGE
jgi:hypothetical protein